MTCLANLEKAGYFQLPASVTELILSYISATHGGHILDPCVDEGTALATLARALNLEPFGVELHEGPAPAVQEAVHEMLAGRDRHSWSHETSFSSEIVRSRESDRVLSAGPLALTPRKWLPRWSLTTPFS